MSVRAVAKKLLPKTVRRRINAAFRRTGIATGALRALPDFLVLGAQKAGTSSLFYYLQHHPNLCLPVGITKEVHYFDKHFDRGANWYRGHFPLRSTIAASAKRAGGVAKTFEATPEYLFHPAVPARVASLLPGAPLVALLRNPVERAFSQYRMEVKRTRESRSFEEALLDERRRIEGAYDASGEPLDVDQFDCADFWYQRRGFYLEQIKRWHAAFPPGQLLIVCAEDLWAKPAPTWERVLDFLGLEYAEPPSFESVNPGQRAPLEPALRDELAEYFRPHNESLYEYLGIDFGWERSIPATA